MSVRSDHDECMFSAEMSLSPNNKEPYLNSFHHAKISKTDQTVPNSITFEDQRMIKKGFQNSEFSSKLSTTGAHRSVLAERLQQQIQIESTKRSVDHRNSTSLPSDSAAI